MNLKEWHVNNVKRALQLAIKDPNLSEEEAKQVHMQIEYTIEYARNTYDWADLRALPDIIDFPKPVS